MGKIKIKYLRMVLYLRNFKQQTKMIQNIIKKPVFLELMKLLSE